MTAKGLTLATLGIEGSPEFGGGIVSAFGTGEAWFVDSFKMDSSHRFLCPFEAKTGRENVPDSARSLNGRSG
jgi:hypothetical protein